MVPASRQWVLMFAIAAISVLPILWMAMGSLRPRQELFQYISLEWHLFVPVKWTLQNYAAIFVQTSKPLGLYIKNTLLVAVTVTALSLWFNSMAAFSFAKLQFRFRKIILPLFMSALVIPGEVTMVPTYLLVHQLGWVDSYTALIVPSVISVFSVFMLIQFFAEIPRELLEAGRIDGASWFGIYSRIAIPSSVPAMITLGLITFLGQWDSYLWPLVVINDETKQMLQVAIATFSNLQNTEWGQILAADTVCSVPIIILFLVLQKYYVQSIVSSGIKG
ncbi:sugar ABC transporter permease [Gordoniibacillus kamchatkensis]|uniref:Sugar ABC transporter permease n=1 Tax=Gordoniibacillus kamchatkensis TaxID=1590651 RepID=A0ABR5AAG7_9BACL|nr:carbohydrate ABC transporter permease [Paenibacillus sp. VKM B-2647]KIL38014.1 sugar ABC transporter permease [Paenibacillus sp. VKM B-2647]